MSLIYTMRAFKTTPTTGYVYWDATGTPDLSGASSPYSPADLADIVTFSVADSGSGGLPDGTFGDVTISGGGTTVAINSDAVTNAKLADMPANTVKLNNTGSPATPVDGTVAQLLSLLNISGYDLGDGSDGSATMDGTTTVLGYTLTNPGASGIYTAARSTNFVDLTVNVGITCINTSHPGPFARGILTNNGNINVDGANASGVTGGVNTTATGPLPTGTSGGNGGGVNSTGSNGLAAGRCIRGFSTVTALGGVGGIPPTAGTAGGTGHGGGGGGSLANGGPGGGITINPADNGDINRFFAATTANVEVATGGTPTKYTCGSGGGGGAGGGTGSSGGGGGAAGSWMVIGAGIFTGSGTISAKGGNGGNGQAATGLGQAGSGGGAGGGGGLVVLIDPSRTAPVPVVTGGQIGTSGTPGSAGAAASAAGVGGDGLVKKWQ